ncbi:MAG: FAD-dependent oxidoreductase [Clostridia bacterium]|nr:FAD-dependent oxidoreductase [Clostridia bacterium]
MRKIQVQVAVIGGSLGGVQAARAAATCGKSVYLCEETDWIGGQLTSQAVPPDENRWIETQGATASYLRYRKDVRDAYRNMRDASEEMRRLDRFCPGNSWVSRLAHDPRLAHRLLSSYLAPYVASGLVQISLNTRPVRCEVAGDRIVSVTVQDERKEETCILADYFLDATDCGDLLKLSGTEYRVGAESRAETGERHAPDTADPCDQQPCTWVAALELTPERLPMEKPEMYDFFRKITIRGNVPQLGWQAWGATGLSTFAMFDGESEEKPLGLWTYRRIQYPPYYTDGRREISLLNWAQNDYSLGNLIDDPQSERHRAGARELTRCCAYWLWEQGYPVRLCGEVLGTQDGLAKAPYIRESRRIVARKQIREEEVAVYANPEPRRLPDSIGVGHYHIDVHMTTRSRFTIYEPAQPFEIPLSGMIPVRMRNLLPACKNIGATHLTGGCFRLHPVEWTVGEAAGYLAAFCLEHGVEPREVSERWTEDFQKVLVEHGFQLHWDCLD